MKWDEKSNDWMTLKGVRKVVTAMSRDEFMKNARQEIRVALCSCENRLMNLIEQAWKNGKQNSEVVKLTELMAEVVNTINNSMGDGDES